MSLYFALCNFVGNWLGLQFAVFLNAQVVDNILLGWRFYIKLLSGGKLIAMLPVFENHVIQLLLQLFIRDFWLLK